MVDYSAMTRASCGQNIISEEHKTKDPTLAEKLAWGFWLDERSISLYCTIRLTFGSTL